MTDTIETIARGNASRIAQMRRTVVRDEAQWQALWIAHAGPDSAVPPVDFTTRMVAAAFQGQRPTAGWNVRITGMRQDDGALTIVVDEGRPEPDMVAAQILVSPFHIVSLPRFDGEVRFAGASDAPVPQPAPPREPPPAPVAAPLTEAMPPRPPAPDVVTTRPIEPSTARPRVPATGDGASSTGLSPNAAAALAYLAGPFSGALLLVVERTSRFVRFHAWQALIGLGALGLVSVTSLGLAFLLLIASPRAFWVMLWISAFSAIAWIGLWGFCLVQAYQGRRWKMPLAGAYAERFTGQ